MAKRAAIIIIATLVILGGCVYVVYQYQFSQPLRLRGFEKALSYVSRTVQIRDYADELGLQSAGVYVQETSTSFKFKFGYAEFEILKSELDMKDFEENLNKLGITMHWNRDHTQCRFKYRGEWIEEYI